MAAAQEALTAIPDRPELYDVLGRAQVLAGDFNQAKAAYGKLPVLPAALARALPEVGGSECRRQG